MLTGNAPVTFRLAANAADGGGSQLGDHVYLDSVTISAPARPEGARHPLRHPTGGPMRHGRPLLALALLASAACGGTGTPAAAPAPAPASAREPAPAMPTTTPVPAPRAAAERALPAGAAEAAARLDASPRHAEWVAIPAGAGDSVRAWVVYPERSDPAPVVLVAHEIYGLTTWIRAVADQLAAEGFIAVAPDLLTGKGVPADSTGDPARDPAVAAIRALDRADVHRRLAATATWGTRLPSATDRHGIVGFCWGGSVAFAHPAHAPEADASVVYYGSSPEVETLERVRAPVLGLYGGDDARVNATIPRADSVMRARGRAYGVHIYEGAGHGFLRQQDGRDGANQAATERAWPETVRWFRQHLER